MVNKYENILNESLTKGKYLNRTDLRLNREYGYLLNKKEYNEYLLYKEEANTTSRIELPLITFNSKKIFYYKSSELLGYIDDYYVFFEGIDNYNTVLRNYDEMSLSMIASELESTLKIEGVNTTRKQVMDIISDDYDIKNENDQIVRNMYNGIKYILAKPLFNKDNLLKLYKLLSYNSLGEENNLNGNDYYRNDMVYVGNYKGIDASMIDEAMDSLFTYINNEINNHNILLPFIAHYYLVYIHPYFDYNGRTARMVAIWISILMGYEYKFPLFISEAINNDKANYYRAIEESRDSRNDLTYFLSYLVGLSNKYLLVYRNLDEIVSLLEYNGEGLSVREINYLKYIIINSNKGWFNHEAFKAYARIDITKQGALKILNYFKSLGLLESKKNSRNEKIFRLNDKIIKYDLSY